MRSKSQVGRPASPSPLQPKSGKPTERMTVAAADSSTAGKVRICHGTASQDKNPYVLIEVNANALKDGHFKDGVGEAHGWHNMPDFIPADGEDCGGPVETTTTTPPTTAPTED